MNTSGLARRCAMAYAISLSLWAFGCAQSETNTSKPDERGQCACAEAAIVDPELLAFLSKARAAHHEADLAEEKGDREAAIRVLRRVVEGPSLPKISPEMREVLSDTRARLADLRSAGGDFDGAMKDVEEGLKLAQQVTHFRGHLIVVRGLLWKRQAKALKEKGDEAGAEKAREEAMKAFEEAIDVQDQVIRNVLPDGTGTDKGSSSGSAP